MLRIEKTYPSSNTRILSRPSHRESGDVHIISEDFKDIVVCRRRCRGYSHHIRALADQRESFAHIQILIIQPCMHIDCIPWMRCIYRILNRRARALIHMPLSTRAHTRACNAHRGGDEHNHKHPAAGHAAASAVRMLAESAPPSSSSTTHVAPAAAHASTSTASIPALRIVRKTLRVSVVGGRIVMIIDSEMSHLTHNQPL